jgi:uncharacterized membrane protein
MIVETEDVGLENSNKLAASSNAKIIVFCLKLDGIVPLDASGKKCDSKIVKIFFAVASGNLQLFSSPLVQLVSSLSRLLGMLKRAAWNTCITVPQNRSERFVFIINFDRSLYLEKMDE